MGVEKVPKEPYFVDFLQDAPEPTGDEDDDSNLEAPKIYEMVGHRIFLLDIAVSDMLTCRCSPWSR